MCVLFFRSHPVEEEERRCGRVEGMQASLDGQTTENAECERKRKITKCEEERERGRSGSPIARKISMLCGRVVHEGRARARDRRDDTEEEDEGFPVFYSRQE